MLYSQPYIRNRGVNGPQGKKKAMITITTFWQLPTYLGKTKGPTKWQMNYNFLYKLIFIELFICAKSFIS